ncbi:MAG: glycine--tRNA ligase [Candidatus Vogelbacteria bacterium CG10_big_fil_rev_8_21_14_0_10_49_38]|uniref:glycine--tRNA ligase n=1 Tax=Candidatus Vogelbacteria bacterium CG10_big_fil_rev_8_21_14_0_10_49_38 TaxID=1975043 RepID=A0A2H0RKJ0_9BACT|nr:MAG: glycine--tRNA ligase [bacterium CG10_49_38]PIR46295.1 MAG: glycine--tRNA ligase [Candidatus Vogelbacteria bacterium CG10_big_fil_rev_8_21_14_0_10_49_38]
MSKNNTMEKIISLAKRRGFVYPGSEIYGGLAGTWDYGPLGVTLKKNIERLWWHHFVEVRDDMYGLDSAILMNPRVWEASGHVAGFNDPLVEDQKTKRRYRADHLLEEAGLDPSGLTLGEMGELITKHKLKSPEGNPLSLPKQFNMMFKTTVGSVDGSDLPVYLRPETAQGMFVNFKNVIDSFHPKLPFGLAQIGRNFRNEIAPRDFIFRVRELEIMEFEYFIRESDWKTQFDYWLEQTREWFRLLGFAATDIKEVEIPDGERAHYSKRTVDFHFKYPHKFDEIGGLAYRTDFDLKNHLRESGADLAYTDPYSNEKLVPHVLEPTFGLGRHLLAVLCKAYTEDELGGESRVVLKFPPQLAPVRLAVFPLLKNKPDLVAKAQTVYQALKREFVFAVFDDNGNIGKRYRRQDEIGTPYCVTIDFETLTDDTVTVRDRDTGAQERINLAELSTFFSSKF